MFQDEDYEILDVVNDKDLVVGQIKRNDMVDLAHNGNRFLRTVEIFIQRQNGDIYLPRRSKEKKIAPGGYDLSAAGHILSGESYEQACIREIKEETGIDTVISNLLFITKIMPSADIFYFRMLYLLRTDQSPRLSPEHIEYSWVKPEELETVIRGDVPTKQTLYEDISILTDYLKRNQPTLPKTV